MCVCVCGKHGGSVVLETNILKLDLKECREGGVLLERRGAITSF